MSDEMKQDTAAIMEGLKALGARFDDMNARFDGLSARVDAGFARLDGEVADVRAENRRIIATVVRLEGKMDDMADRMATKDDVSTVLGHVDGLAGRIDDMNLRWANHDDRITAVEKRRPT